MSRKTPPFFAPIAGWLDRHPWPAMAMFVAVVGLLAVWTARHLNVPGHPEVADWGLQDFRDTIYLPAVAVLEGINPYDAADYLGRCPAGNAFPLYSPFSLLLHGPFALLPYEISEWLYFALTAALYWALAWSLLRCCGVPPTLGRVAGLATLILLSRPGHMNLMAGQMVLQVVLGTVVALHYARRRPWLAGLGLAVATLKPSFGGPLALLMLARRDYRAVAAGFVLGALGAALGAGVIVARTGEASGLLTAALVNDAAFETDPVANPLTSPLRIDAAVTLAKSLNWSPAATVKTAITTLSMLLAMLVLLRCPKPDAEAGADDCSAVLICVTVLTALYHILYDALLLSLPVVALAVGRPAVWRAGSAWVRWGLWIILMVTAFNLLGTNTALRWFEAQHGLTAWRLATMSHSLLLLLAWAGCLIWLLLSRAACPKETGDGTVGTTAEEAP